MGDCPPPPPPFTDFYPEAPPCYTPPQHPFPDSREKRPPAQSRLNPVALVQALSRLNGQWSKVEPLSNQVQCDVDKPVKAVKARKDVFSYMQDDSGGVVELVPKVGLCLDYMSSTGCVNKDSCRNLHICKVYVTEFCNEGASCPFGHRWDTDHNGSVLSKLFLDLIDKKDLHHVIRKVCKNAVPKVCGFYSSAKGCRYNEKCSRLHICNDCVQRRKVFVRQDLRLQP